MNNLKEFKNFLENGDSDIKNYINAIQYGYNLDLNNLQRKRRWKCI
ncbi:MAG: hypothetical protein V8R51_04395 [Clostridia bacterium]